MILNLFFSDDCLIEILVSYFFSWSLACFLSFFFLVESAFSFFFLDSYLFSWSKACFLFFFLKSFFHLFPPQNTLAGNSQFCFRSKFQFVASVTWPLMSVCCSVGWLTFCLPRRCVYFLKARIVTIGTLFLCIIFLNGLQHRSLTKIHLRGWRLMKI